MFKLIKQPFNQVLAELLLKEDFLPILFFLLEHQEERVTLRDMKRQLPMIQDWENVIDTLVEEQLVTRVHGRYTTGVVCLTTKAQQHLIDCWQQQLPRWVSIFEEYLKNVPMEQRFYALMTGLNDSMTDETPFILFEESESAKEWLKAPIDRTFEVMNGHVLSVFQPSTWAFHGSKSQFFDYLTLKSQESIEDDTYHHLVSRLGDINPEYYVNYTDRKLRRLLKGKVIHGDKADIMMVSLLDMGYVRLEEGCYHGNIRQIQPLDTAIIKKWYEEEVVPVISTMGDQEKKVAPFVLKALMYQALVEANSINEPDTPYCMVEL